MITQQATTAARLADKDEVFAALQQQIAESPDPETTVENDTDGA